MVKYIIAILSICVFVALKASGQEFQKCDSFRKAKYGTYVIAHRGAHIGIPENSIPAYQKAIDLGCDFVEIDVRTTKDGKFVSVHNSAIDNYTNGVKGKVNEMTLEELKSLDIGSTVGENWKNTRIPAFDEILALCKGKIGIYLDLKDAPIAELMQIIRKHQMENDIIWYISAKYLMEQDNIDTLFGSSFPMPDPGAENTLQNVLTKLKPCVVATDMGVLSGNFLQLAHEAGAKVFVDENKGTESEWKQILNWNTDGIQTDNPENLIRYLQKQNR